MSGIEARVSGSADAIADELAEARIGVSALPEAGGPDAPPTSCPCGLVGPNPRSLLPHADQLRMTHRTHELERPGGREWWSARRSGQAAHPLSSQRPVGTSRFRR